MLITGTTLLLTPRVFKTVKRHCNAHGDKHWSPGTEWIRMWYDSRRLSLFRRRQEGINCDNSCARAGRCRDNWLPASAVRPVAAPSKKRVRPRPDRAAKPQMLSQQALKLRGTHDRKERRSDTSPSHAPSLRRRPPRRYSSAVRSAYIAAVTPPPPPPPTTICRHFVQQPPQPQQQRCVESEGDEQRLATKTVVVTDAVFLQRASSTFPPPRCVVFTRPVSAPAIRREQFGTCREQQRNIDGYEHL